MGPTKASGIQAIFEWRLSSLLTNEVVFRVILEGVVKGIGLNLEPLAI